MKISIITAVYNRVDTIERAIRSVGSQSYPNIEHIVIDGGSTDGTLERLRGSLGSDAILVSEPDRGIYDAINKGLRLATGDVVGLLHSDDFFSSNEVLFEVVECFTRGEVDAVYGDAAFFAPQMPGKIVRRYSSARFSPARLGWGWMPAHTTLFLRLDVYRKFGYYNLDYRIAADFDFICRIFFDRKLRSVYVPKFLVHMQTGGLSTSGWRSNLTVYQEVIRACRENHIDTNVLKLLLKYPLKFFEFF